MNPHRIWDKWDENLTTHCQNLKIMFGVEFQTSFRNSIIIFFKKLWTKRKFVNKAKFYLQKSVWDFESLIKSYGQNSKKMFENVKKNVPSNPSLKFFYNFWLEAWIFKQIFRDEIWFDLPTLYSPIFLKKIILQFLNEV